MRYLFFLLFLISAHLLLPFSSWVYEAGLGFLHIQIPLFWAMHLVLEEILFGSAVSVCCRPVVGEGVSRRSYALKDREAYLYCLNLLLPIIEIMET